MSDWGPWIEHDGKGCPLPVGTIGEAELRCGRIAPFRALCGSTRGGPQSPPTGAGKEQTDAWTWGGKPSGWEGEEVIRYRIRKPRGLTILEEILNDLPETVDA